VAAKPAFSPFEQSQKRFDEKPVGVAPVRAVAPVVAPKAVVVEPVEMKVPVVEVQRSAAPVRPVEVTPAPVVVAAPQVVVAGSAAEFQRVAIEALQRVARQETAADALEDATWTVEGDEIRVQMEVSKTMLPMVVNAEAEKVVRAALRESGSGALKLVLLPGSGATSAAAKKPRAATSGSMQAKALEHPIVQQAQRLFDAEIRTVIDLREGE
jgi:DNA polymerase-3 subunit gamma/tau